ncbi:MAG: NhaA family Na+:H+ antiporter [Granulosicoccus sp.]|jgi:NhaA family Na+:H+ antiporter
MVIFSFLLGLEIKREVLARHLAQSEKRRMLYFIFCAIGGMVIQAIIYSVFNWSLDSQIGWGIPLATDTAFAMGVLTIVRKRISVSLLAFVVGLANVDDVGAILVIAIFYTQGISFLHLTGAFTLITFLVFANYADVRNPLFYSIFGVSSWWMMLKSGIHPTVAGVAVAYTVPARPKLASGMLQDGAKSIVIDSQK